MAIVPIDIDRWVNRARMFVQDFDEDRKAEVVMILVDEQQHDRFESHCFDDRPTHARWQTRRIPFYGDNINLQVEGGIAFRQKG